MKILVVDDCPRNQQAAREQLTGHELVIVGTSDEALRAIELAALNSVQFDVVLTDMELPKSATREEICANNLPGAPPEEEYVYRAGGAINSLGFPIAMFAVWRGVKMVAMVTSTYHHHGAMASAVSMVRGHRFEINGARAVFMADCMTGSQASRTDPRVKDWKNALERLTS